MTYSKYTTCRPLYPKRTATTNTTKVQQYDNGIKLYFNITKDTFTEPIQGAIVNLKFMNNATGTVMCRVCDITDVELAECLYVLKYEDLTEVGIFNTEIQVDYSNGVVLSIDNPFVLEVTQEHIPKSTYTG